MADTLRNKTEARPGAAATQSGESTVISQRGLEAQNRRAQQRAIGQGLRQFFDAVVSEPIPDEFIELLRRIDQERGARSK